MNMVLSWDEQPRLCQPRGVYSACFCLGTVAPVLAAFHNASSMGFATTCWPSHSHLQSLFIPIFAHLCHHVVIPFLRSLVTFSAPRIYLHINAPFAAFNSWRALFISFFALFRWYCTCLTLPSFHCAPFLDSQHYHKVLQHYRHLVLTEVYYFDNVEYYTIAAKCSLLTVFAFRT